MQRNASACQRQRDPGPDERLELARRSVRSTCGGSRRAHFPLAKRRALRHNSGVTAPFWLFQRTRMIRKLSALALVLAALTPGLADALEVKNIRSCYGPLGAKRGDAKFLPGDVLFIHFDIQGLQVNDKTKTVNYYTVLEFFDSKGNTISSKKNDEQKLIPSLGGDLVPDALTAVMGDDQPPGKYTVKLTIHDVNAKSKTQLSYPFDLQKRGFGVIRVLAPAFGVTGGSYAVQFSLVDLPLDKNGRPSAEITLRVLDEDGKKEVGPSITSSLPRDLPPGEDKLKEKNLVPVVLPLTSLNRSGRFTIDIDVTEKIMGSSRPLKLQFPLTVFELK